MARAKNSTDAVLAQLRAFGLAYPGAHTKSPWPGHLDLAVNDKTFAYLSIEGEPFSIGCKLPATHGAALTMFPFAIPTPYGLGKSGWVTAQFPPDREPPVELLKQWIDESYRAQAPKKLIAQRDAALGISPAKPAARGAVARSTPKPAAGAKPGVKARAKAAPAARGKKPAARTTKR